MSANMFDSPAAPLVLPTGEPLTLSGDQEIASKRIINFMLDPEQKNLILKGYAGSGKSTLLRSVLDSMPTIKALANLTGGSSAPKRLILSATTNKAAGALRQTTGQGAETVHSELGLTLQRSTVTHKQELVSTKRTKPINKNSLLIIDEAYMSDHNLLALIEEFTQECKILWVGDPAQLLPVGLSYMPLIAKGYDSVALNEVIRQAADSPIIQMATLCRYAVETGKFFRFTPDGEIIRHLPRDQFAASMLAAFDEHYGHPGAVKVLAWTNRTTQEWNAHVKQTMKGSMDIRVGDYVVCNSAIHTSKASLRTDQTVQVTGRTDRLSAEGIPGFMYEIDGQYVAFGPKDIDDKKALIKGLRKNGDESSLIRAGEIEDEWIDLRDEYACTINKSQGSTYGTTYIDLDDISKCRFANALARLLYVAISRPRDKIVFTGDISS